MESTLGASAALAGTIALWVVLIWRLAARHRTVSRFDVVWIGIALAVTIEVKQVVSASFINYPMAHIVMTVGVILAFVAATEMLRLFTWDAAHGGDEESDWARWWPLRLTALAVTAVLVVAAIAGQPLGPNGSPDWTSNSWMAVYWGLTGAFQFALCAYMLYLSVAFVGTSHPGPLRQAMVLIAACLAGALAYSICLMLIAGDAIGAVSAQWAYTGYELATLTYLFVAAAAVRVMLSRVSRRTVMIAYLEQLRPLWAQLAPSSPEVTLSGFPENLEDMSRAELKFALVRVVAEIQEWEHRLANILPVDSWDRALFAARRHALPEACREQCLAEAEAGWILAHLGARKVKCGGGHAHDSNHPSPSRGQDVESDLSLLLAVSQVPPARAQAIAAAVLNSEGPSEPVRETVEVSNER